MGNAERNDRAARVIQAAWSKRSAQRSQAGKGDSQRPPGPDQAPAASWHATNDNNPPSSPGKEHDATTTTGDITKDGEHSPDSPRDPLTAQSRWDDAILRHKLDAQAGAAQSGSKNDAADRWKRGALYAQQISGPSMKEDGEEGTKDRPKSPPSDSHISRTNTTSLKDMALQAKAFAYGKDGEDRKRASNGQKAVKVKKELEEQH